jgi:hypothetical protein
MPRAITVPPSGAPSRSISEASIHDWSSWRASRSGTRCSSSSAWSSPVVVAKSSATAPSELT